MVAEIPVAEVMQTDFLEPALENSREGPILVGFGVARAGAAQLLRRLSEVLGTLEASHAPRTVWGVPGGRVESRDPGLLAQEIALRPR